jgi:two-component system chemotaxis response regulator CheY
MPGVGGIEALRSILEYDPCACVAMITALDEKFLLRKAKEIGARGYIVKPFSPSKVIERLREIVASRQGGEAIFSEGEDALALI